MTVLTMTIAMLPAVLGLGAGSGANGPLAVKVSKQVMVESSQWSDDEVWKKQSEIVMPIFASEDAIEGSTAFAEQRAPNWPGK